MAVCVGDVGLDVKNGGAVHEVRTGDMDHGAKLLRHFHTQQLHTGKAQIVGPEGGPGGEDAHPGIAAQPRRPHRGGPARPDRLGKLPDNPQMGETLDAAQCIGVAVFRLKNDGRAQLLHQMGLPGDAEFGGKIAAHFCDDVNLYAHM